MTLLNHEAKKKFWSKFSKEQKSEIMSDRAKKMWARRSLAEKRAKALQMLNGKIKKKRQSQRNVLQKTHV